MFRRQAALWVKNICDQNNFTVNYMHFYQLVVVANKSEKFISIIFPTLLLRGNIDMDMCVRLRRGTLNVKD